MDDYQNTPSIIAQEITSFRGGQRLAYGDLTGPEKRDYLFDTAYSKTSLVAKHSRVEIRQIAPKTYLVRSSGTRRSCSTSLSNSRVE